MKFCNSPFWDSNLTWFTPQPFFTSCFEDAIATIPTMFICVSLCGFQLCHTANFERKLNLKFFKRQLILNFQSVSLMSLLKCFAVVSLIGIRLVQITMAWIGGNEEWSTIVSGSISIIGYVGGLIFSYINYCRGIKNSGIEFGFWLLETLVQGVLFRTTLVNFQGVKRSVVAIATLLTFPLAALRFLLELFNSTCFKKKQDVQQHKFDSHPERTASFFSRALLVWYDKLAWTGYRRTLTSNDLWELTPNDTASILFETFSKNWERHKCGSLRSVIIPILKMFGGKYALAVAIKLGGSGLTLLQPILVRCLIFHISSTEEEAWKGYFYMCIAVSSVAISSILTVHSDKMAQVIAMRIQSALSNAVYRKSLCISNAAKTKDGSVGAMMNLISVDAQKIMEIYFAHNATPAPLVIGVCTYILWETVGWAAFVGLGIFFIAMVVSNVLTIFFGAKIQHSGMKLKDQRIRITSEVLSGIKVLKFYGWEIPFEKKIYDIRKLELLCIWKLSWIKSLGSSIFAASPILVSIATFSCYLLASSENILTPTKIFVLISIMNILKSYMVILPVAFMFLSQFYVSVRRLDNFFSLEELDKVTQNNAHIAQSSSTGHSIQIQNGSFSWTGNECAIQDISMSVSPTELVAIVGQVASGKSSLLAAILGDMKKITGKVHSEKSIAYVSQTPWIQNATLRGNILFGLPYEPDKYEAVIGACALSEDIRLLPNGDLTEIGESGINLSGGQKQRVALARAAYKDAMLYLLDDPLSAVDATVARHIFESLLGPNGILSKKARLLVTHNTSLLPSANQILVIKNGRITESGTFQNLIESKGELSEVLKNVESEKMKNLEDNDVVAEKSTLLHSDVAGKLVVPEYSALGNIKFNFYYKYFSSAGFPALFAAIMFFAVSEGLAGYNNYYLSGWGEDENGGNDNLQEYLLLGVGQTIANFIGYALLAVICVVGTRKLHEGALGRILRCPIGYFESTLRGTLLSRFSRDVEITDFTILNLLQLLSVNILWVIVTVIMITITIPHFLLALLPISVIFVLFQRFYAATSRQLKRIESVSRSPIFSHFGETLAGVSSIRAFGAESAFISECERRIDSNQKNFFAFAMSGLWANERLELIGAVIVLFTALFLLLGRETMDPGKAGLAITYAFSIPINLRLFAKLFSELENNLVSVERLSELLETPQEKPWGVQETKPKGSWPDNGELKFENYGTRYREGLDLVLKRVNFTVGAKEKVGVVGRTGAGKSSLTLALFRLLEPSQGRVVIDGVDVSTLGLQDLRRRITIIPQEPLLFCGSLRENLDPFEEYSDAEIWSSLELAHLKPKIRAGEKGLDFNVEEDGKNFSVGERQLICLARALLRQSKILVLDEATAAVDLETDELIQGTIRREFLNSTVLTIAHRLNTVMNSDRVMVLSNGEIVEFDTPSKLLKNTQSAFSEMLRNSSQYEK